MIYDVGLGHFISTIAENNLPFDIVLAANVSVHGRSFVYLSTKCPCDYHQRHGLHSIVIHVNNTCPNGTVQTFNQELVVDGWLLSNFPVYYPDFGDSIDGTAKIVLGIYSSTGATEEPTLTVPPATPVTPIDSFILCEFHKENYILYWIPDSVLFQHPANIFEVRPSIFVTEKSNQVHVLSMQEV